MKDTYIEIDEGKVIRVRDWMIAGEDKVSIAVFSKMDSYSVLKKDLEKALEDVKPN